MSGEPSHTANHQNAGRMAESRSGLRARIAEIRDDAEQVGAFCTHASTKTLIERVRLELSEIVRLYLSSPPLTAPPLPEARLLVAVGSLVDIEAMKLQRVKSIVQRSGIHVDIRSKGI